MTAPAPVILIHAPAARASEQVLLDRARAIRHAAGVGSIVSCWERQFILDEDALRRRVEQRRAGVPLIVVSPELPARPTPQWLWSLADVAYDVTDLRSDADLRDDLANCWGNGAWSEEPC